MLRVSMVGHAFADVDATIITIDGPSLLCWADDGLAHGRDNPAPPGCDGEPVARYSLDQVLSVRLAPPGMPGSDANRGRASRPDPEHPNAFRRWTAEQEDALIAGFHRGETVEQLAAAVGRRVGGVRARLISLGVIEPEPGDRLRFPGTPAVAAAVADARGDGTPGAGRPPRPLLRAVELEGKAGRRGADDGGSTAG